MSDLIARLQKPFLPSANGAYDGGIRLPLEARQELMDAAAIRTEAAAALAAQDAEMREHQKALAAERADVAAALAEARDKLDAQDAEIASLRARLAAAEGVVEKSQQWKLARKETRASLHVSDDDWVALCAKEKGAALSLEAALAAHDAAKETSDAG